MRVELGKSYGIITTIPMDFIIKYYCFDTELPHLRYTYGIIETDHYLGLRTDNKSTR